MNALSRRLAQFMIGTLSSACLFAAGEANAWWDRIPNIHITDAGIPWQQSSEHPMWKVSYINVYFSTGDNTKSARACRIEKVGGSSTCETPVVDTDNDGVVQLHPAENADDTWGVNHAGDYAYVGWLGQGASCHGVMIYGT